MRASNEILRSISAAITEAITSRSLAICSFAERRPVGSGVAVSWRARRFIVTAAHVLQGRPLSDLRFLSRPEGSLDLRDSAPSGVGSQTKPWFSMQIINVKLSNGCDDLACLKIDPTFDAKRHNLIFHEMQPVSIRFRAGSYVLIHGFPRELVRRSRGATTLSSNNEWGRVARPVRLSIRLQGYSPRRHLLISRIPTSRGQAHIETYLMSGSGIWRTPPPRPGGLWTPTNASLIGIFVSTYFNGRPNELRKGTRIARLCRLLSSFDRT
jgi:hypothetical protein